MDRLQNIKGLMMFRNNLSISGYPKWSQWSPTLKEQVTVRYEDLIQDMAFVGHWVGTLMRFRVKYSAVRMARMIAIQAGYTAWSQVGG